MLKQKVALRVLMVWVLGLIGMMIYSGAGYGLEVGQVDIHGFASQGFMQSSGNNYLGKTLDATYKFNEAAINFNTELTDKLRIGLQLYARDLGDVSQGEVKLDWGFADYHWRDELGIRLGKVKVPMGLYNEGREIDMMRTYVFLPQSVYNEGFRDFQSSVEGGSLYGHLNGKALGSLDYATVLGNSSFDITQPVNAKLIRGFTVLPVDLNNVDLSFKYASYTQLMWNTPLNGLKLGVTQGFVQIKADLAYQATIAAPSPLLPPGVLAVITTDYPYSIKADYQPMLLSGEYKFKDLTLQCEYMKTRVKVAFDYPPELLAFGVPEEVKVDWLGYYLAAAYRFTNWLELGGYYSVYYPNTKDKDGTEQSAYTGKPDYAGWQNDNCLTARFDINSFWLVKLEGHHVNGVAQVTDYDDPNDLRKSWYYFAAKTSINF